MRFLLPISGLLQAGAGFLCGAEPVLTHLHPAGIQPGTKTSVKLTGTFDPWPCQIWCDTPGIVFTPAADSGKFEVTVAADTTPGPHLIRAFHAGGVSAPVALMIDPSPQTLEVEPNNNFLAPQILSGPTTTLNGKLDKTDDVDSFLIPLQQGQTLVTSVEAYVLAAGFDAMLRIVDPHGVTLAFNHDHTTMDPFLVFTAPHDGPYIVQIMGQKYPAASEIRFAGGDDCVYRLHCTTGPWLNHPWPLMVQRGTPTTVALEGWNLPANHIPVTDGTTPPFPLPFSDIPELTETTGPQSLEIPSAISGRIEASGDEDHFSFATLKDTVLAFTVTGPDQGSAIDAWLKLLDKDGKELSSNDDQAGSRDPAILWTAPADGTYTAAVGDLTQRGGNDYFYRLQIVRAVPSVTAAVTWHSAKVEAGKSTGLKVSVSFTGGFKEPLKLIVAGLPPGLTAPEGDVPEKGGEVLIQLDAAADAPPASLPFRLLLRETPGGKEHPVLYSMISTSEDNGVPKGYQHLLIPSTHELWLTVSPPPPPPPAK